eukprot:CAMPEP_0119405904 /NCGR_PEP_ID=MMETSP1335-20130426/434_1 /TAXON_ID=259385 /ORGANISM="Chrysoculter rhomboideus, Strain RCC1486" /LENGTH=111 /DNA_ID=CAMNT_0007429951 /DNA_START=186 /DNA_END=521 /DNA_ORIENTATION=+
MTAVRVYHTMMTAQVFPAVCSASERADRVNVQQDGASAHTGKDMLRRLNEFGATMSPQIIVQQQPSNSTDLDICAFSCFRALTVSMRKLCRQGTDQLAEDVMKAFELYPCE